MSARTQERRPAGHQAAFPIAGSDTSIDPNDTPLGNPTQAGNCSEEVLSKAHLLEEAARTLRESWAELAGARLAAMVLDAGLCHRTARAALITLGLCGGMGSADIARKVVLPFEREYRRLVMRNLEAIGDHEEA
ncbi:MAG: hypothetical protein R2755_23540 [Acidimicrobiales bacterium]